MKKVMLSAIVASVIIAIVFWGNWTKLLHLKIAIIAVMSMFASYYQASYNPLKVDNANVDKGTVLHIIWTIYLSQFFSLIEAVYFKYPYSMEFNFNAYAFLTIAIFGLLIRSWAYLTLGKFFTMHLETQTDHKIVNSGPYKWLRHPSYTGAFFLYAFLPLFFEAYMTAAITVPFLLWAFYRRIIFEEKMLVETLGNDYIDFCKERSRIFPFIW